jgi:arylsulfatase A-like enzyme
MTVAEQRQAQRTSAASSSLIASLWSRLVSVAIVGLVFAEALVLAPGKVQGWTFYLSTREVVFEVVVRLVVAALAGIVLGTLASALFGVGLMLWKTSREQALQIIVAATVALMLYLNTRFALITLNHWSGRGFGVIKLLLIAHFLVFVAALLLPRARRELLGSMDPFVSLQGARNVIIVTVLAALGLAVTEWAFGHRSQPVNAATGQQHPRTNIVLVTFDALSADDMPLYGYKLPTTPNIDAFARRSTTFTNFYSVTTFTSPAIATIWTGSYPSQTGVFQLQGTVRPEYARHNLPQLMREAGYATGAFLSNPFAHYVTDTPGTGFEILPEPVFQTGGLQRVWDLTRPLHQNSGIGSRVAEYQDIESIWNSWWHIPGNLSMRLRPDAVFESAGQVLQQLPDGFFLWVHVITPHHPYLPDTLDQGRFLPADEGAEYAEDSERQWVPHYDPDQQAKVDRRRLLYDEFILTADRAFGRFLENLGKTGKLNNTAVILSADHGESFEGGVFRHESEYLTRPTVHVPLIISMPGQTQGRSVSVVADQTAIAPTIADLANQSKPNWMHGQSLAPWLSAGNAQPPKSFAFSQFLEKNSVFKPLTHGTAGVIDGEYQYVLDLDTGKGKLRPLDQAHIWDLDRSAENPAKAQELLGAIYSQFPGLKERSK